MRRVMQILSERINLLSHYHCNEGGPDLLERRRGDSETSENIYWHAGYRAALIDAVQLLQAVDPDSSAADRPDYTATNPRIRNYH